MAGCQEGVKPLAELKLIHMATEIWVNIGSGNGLLPDGTKPLPEAMLTYQWGPVTITCGQFRKRYLSH